MTQALGKYFQSNRFTQIDECRFGKRIVVKINKNGYKESTFAPFINNKQEVYLSCSKKKILLKHFVLCIIRPLHGLIKWVLIPIEVGMDIYRGEFKKNIFRRIGNIVTIPLYTLAMEICYLAGIILSIGDPNILYKTREVSGKLELLMYQAKASSDHRARDDLIPLIAQCFTPMIVLTHLDYIRDKEDEIRI